MRNMGRERLVQKGGTTLLVFESDKDGVMSVDGAVVPRACGILGRLHVLRASSARSSLEEAFPYRSVLGRSQTSHSPVHNSSTASRLLHSLFNDSDITSRSSYQPALQETFGNGGRD